MHKSLKSVAVIVFTVLGFLYGSAAQNCAIPQHVFLPLDDSVQTECAEVGTVLTSLKTKNIQSFKNLIVTPSNFIRVELDKNGTIQLIVDQPLFQSKENSKNETIYQKSYIDETWSQSIEAQLDLECGDGIRKVVSFTVPIADKNTQPPVFSSPNYTLTMGPCVNGTHDKACPLNFETSILVYDADRDFINADMNFTTKGSENIIRFSSSIVQISPRSDFSEFSPNNFVRNVRLYLQESDHFSIGDTFEFTLVAYNNGTLSPSGERLNASTLITIRFGPFSDGENPNVLKPPVFSSKAYYATVDIFQTLPGVVLDSIKPGSVAAHINSVDAYRYGYGPDPEDPDTGEEYANLTVRYGIKPYDILDIDPDTGKLSFNENATLTLTDQLDISSERLYEITAVFETYEFLPARVPLLVLFNAACPSTGTPCEEMTTPYANTTESTEAPTYPPTMPPPTTTRPNSTTTTTLSPSTVHPNSTTFPPPTPTPTTTNPNGTITATTLKPTTTAPTTIMPGPTTDAPDPTTDMPHPTTNMPNFTTTTPNPTMTSPFDTTTTPTPTSTTQQTTTTITPTPTTTQGTTIPSTTRVTTTHPPPSSSTAYPTTTSTWLTTFITSENPTSPAGSTTEPPEEDCCEACNIVKDFECPESNPDPSLLFPDPHDCRKYYGCIFDDNSSVPNIIPHVCEEEGQIFCPELQDCVIPTMCICTGFNPTTCDPASKLECETCDSYPVTHPNNLCNNHTDEIPANHGRLPDPIYKDIFHACQKTDNPQLFIDIIMPCGRGLIYCQDVEHGQCDFPHSTTELCKSVNLGKGPYKCNPCYNYYMSIGIKLPYS